MQINDEWRIEADELNIVLLKKGKGKKGSETPYYYATISGALTALLEKQVRSTALTDLKAINDIILKTEKEIKTLVANIPRNALQTPTIAKQGID